MLCDFALQNTNNPHPSPPSPKHSPPPPLFLPSQPFFPAELAPGSVLAVPWEWARSVTALSPRRVGAAPGEASKCSRRGGSKTQTRDGEFRQKGDKKKKKKRKRLSRGSKKTGMEETCSALSNPTRPQLLCREFPTQAASNPTPACTKNMLNNSDFTRVLSSCTILPAPRDWCGLSGGKTTME